MPDDERPEERNSDYDRTVSLSDGVFAIALTLLVLKPTYVAFIAFLPYPVAFTARMTTNQPPSFRTPRC